MYRCEVCKYTAKQKSHYNKHLLTKKHQRNITRENIEDNTNKGYNNTKILQNAPKLLQNAPKLLQNAPKKMTKPIKSNSKKSKKFICEYCNNKFIRKFNLKKHYNRCKIKNKMEISLKERELELIRREKKLEQRNKEVEEILENKEKEVNDILESREKEVNEILESKEKYKKEVIDLKKMVFDNQREFIDYAKDTKRKNVSNIYYIQNNYRNALTMDQLLNEWQITYPEWVQASTKGYVAGCTELIENRFLQNKSLSERPLHCLDPSRGIFLYNNNEIGWMKNSPLDLNSVITNVDTKFNEFNKDYQQAVPIDNQTREKKIKNKEEDPIIFHHISDKLSNFIPPKYKREEDKDSEHEKSKKKIIKNISVKCAFNKPSRENIVIENITDLQINC